MKPVPNTAAIIYHRADFDGICSYAITRKALENEGLRVTPIPFNYNEKVPELSEYAEVFIVDVSLPDALMAELNHNGRLTWIDHHITAITRSQKAGFADARGIRRIGIAACELCWNYFFENEPVPNAVHMLSLYDVHNIKVHSWNDVLAFQYGMRERYSLDAELFRAEFDQICMAGWTESIIPNGVSIVKYLRQMGEIAVRSSAISVDIIGEDKAPLPVKALALLTPHHDSMPYEQAARERGCQVLVCLSPSAKDDLYRVSAYAIDPKCDADLGHLMYSRYGGGGHKGAAGATLSEQEFITIITMQRL